MNAAARLIHQNILSRHGIVSLFFNKKQMILMALGLCVLISALFMVYVTNTTRCLNANLHQTLAERESLHIQWGQLLLEKSTRTMAAKIQHIAENQLGMLVPDNKSVVIVNE